MMIGLSPYATEFTKLAVSKAMRGYLRRGPKFIKGPLRRRRKSNLLKAAAPKLSPEMSKRLGLGSLIGLGSVGTLGAQSAAKDWNTGRKYNNAVEAQQKEQRRRAKLQLKAQLRG